MKTASQVQLASSLRHFLATVKEEMISLHARTLAYLVLFGSQARGDARPDSDVDVMVVLDMPEDRWDSSVMTNTHADLSIELLLAHEWFLSTVTVSLDRFRAKKEPLFWNVEEEGVILLDLAEK